MSSSTPRALSSSVAGCTEVKVEHLSYDWVIKRFKYLSQGPGEPIYSPIFCTNDEVEWKLCLHPRGHAPNHNYGYICLYLHSHKSEKINVEVYGEISILPSGFKTTRYHTYKKEGELGLAFYRQRSKLCDHDVITIHIEMEIPSETVTESIGTNQLMEQAFDSQGGQWTQDFRQLFEQPKFSDIDVIVGSQKFPAHKLVLATRSSVFAAMFEHKETQENIRNEVKIEKMGPEVVKAMLEFCYTDEVTNLEDLAYELLEAADKYDLPRLRSMCEKILCKTLDKANAAEILLYTDLHHSLKLKEYVMRFMDDNLLGVMKTDGYKEMKEKYPALVDELMLTIAIRKEAKQ